MKDEEMFVGFSVAAGGDRFGSPIQLDGESISCKVSGRDTGGAMSVFEFSGVWPRHSNREQDEWLYVVEGEFDIELGANQFRVRAGQSVFIPRGVPHVWGKVGKPGAAKVINVYQPAGNMEEFFRIIAGFADLPTRQQVIEKSYTEEQIAELHRLFDAHGMNLLGSRLVT